ncbi:MAG: hypothetical protein QNJ38_05305 [Prochloraceae cyanobacterium]|nr:hypothetical protein [Prochloraceae cyanobacterium]
MKEKFLVWLNRLLIADVFLVMFGGIWFLIAAIGKFSGLPLGLDLFYKLWQPLFNPAISILIGGAILNWLIDKVSKKVSSN